MDTKQFPKLIEQIYDAVEKLEKMTDDPKYVNGKRRFTPDGHMVGSIGEVLAMYHYDIELNKASTEKHDGTVGERNVQIKATQRNAVAVSSVPDSCWFSKSAKMENLLVLKISKDGKAEEIYNGPGGFVDALMKSKPEAKRPKNGQYQIGLGRLKQLIDGSR